MVAAQTSAHTIRSANADTNSQPRPRQLLELSLSFACPGTINFKTSPGARHDASCEAIVRGDSASITPQATRYSASRGRRLAYPAVTNDSCPQADSVAFKIKELGVAPKLGTEPTHNFQKAQGRIPRTCFLQLFP